MNEFRDNEIMNLTEPQEKANAFNKYFVNVATDIKSCIRYSKDTFHGFLP